MSASKRADMRRVAAEDDLELVGDPDDPSAPRERLLEAIVEALLAIEARLEVIAERLGDER